MKRVSQAGFTLVELLVVIAIIGILTAVGIPMYNGYQANAKNSSAKTNYTNMKTYIAAEITKCTTGMSPTLNDPKAAPTTVTCPSGITPGTAATYFVAVANKTIKNAYNSADTTPAIAGAGAASAANVGRFYVNAADTTCTTGVSVVTVVQNPATNAYELFPVAAQCIAVQ